MDIYNFIRRFLYNNSYFTMKYQSAVYLATQPLDFYVIL